MVTSGLLLCAAFLSLLLCPVDLARTIGIGGAVTVGCCLLCSLTMLPTLLLFMAEICPYLLYRLSGRALRCCKLQ